MIVLLSTNITEFEEAKKILESVRNVQQYNIEPLSLMQVKQQIVTHLLSHRNNVVLPKPDNISIVNEIAEIISLSSSITARVIPYLMRQEICRQSSDNKNLDHYSCEYPCHSTLPMETVEYLQSLLTQLS